MDSYVVVKTCTGDAPEVFFQSEMESACDAAMARECYRFRKLQYDVFDKSDGFRVYGTHDIWEYEMMTVDECNEFYPGLMEV